MNNLHEHDIAHNLSQADCIRLAQKTIPLYFFRWSENYTNIWYKIHAEYESKKQYSKSEILNTFMGFMHTFARGARQLVVQLALETISIAGL